MPTCHDATCPRWPESLSGSAAESSARRASTPHLICACFRRTRHDSHCSTAGDKQLEFHHQNDRLHISFPVPIHAGQKLTRVVSYHGNPATGLFIGGNKYGDRVFFTDNWPNKARTWLATIDHISVKAPKTISVTASMPASSAQTTATAPWRSGKPIPPAVPATPSASAQPSNWLNAACPNKEPVETWRQCAMAAVSAKAEVRQNEPAIW